jgi:hypothetical protein
VCCEHLVCANCAQLVADGRCAVCRATRDAMHHPGTLSRSTLVVMAALVALVAVLALHLTG